MKIKVRTDSRVETRPEVIAEITSEVESGLARFQDRLTRVEVHLSDINGPRSGIDHRCLIEARAAGRDPMAVSHEAEFLLQAVREGIGKMARQLQATFDKESTRKDNTSASGLST